MSGHTKQAPWWSVLAAGCILGAAILTALAPPAHAVKPPADRTYFTVFFGIGEPYGFATDCFVFAESGFCDQDGQLCGSWLRQDRKGRETGFSFEMTFLEDGVPVTLEGQARTDARGPKSAIAGTGRLIRGEAMENFSFAAREVEAERCRELLESSPGSNPTQIVGSGNVASESRSVEGFEGVALSGVGEVEIRHTGTESLMVSADDNIVQYLTSEVRDRRLLLGSEPDVSFQTRNPIRFEVGVIELDEIIVAGVGAIGARGIDTDELTVGVTGVAAVVTEGRAERQKVTIRGVSGYQGRRLESRFAEVDLTGVCSAEVRVSERLSGKVQGLCTLEYIGSPVLDLDVARTATVRRVGG